MLGVRLQVSLLLYLISGLSVNYGCDDAKYHRYLQKLAGKKNLAISKYHEKVNEFAKMVEDTLVKHVDAMIEKDGRVEIDAIDELKKTVLQVK